MLRSNPLWVSASGSYSNLRLPLLTCVLTFSVSFILCFNRSLQSRPPLVQDRPLRVPEGVYLIRNALYGYVIESEHLKAPKKQRRSAHIYVVPSRDGSSPYQLWTIFQRRGEDSEYTIRNFATGAVLDVNCSSPEDGTQVIGYSAFGSPNQTWTIYGSRQSTS